MKNALDNGIPRVGPQHGRACGLPQAYGPLRLAVQLIQGPNQGHGITRRTEETVNAVFTLKAYYVAPEKLQPATPAPAGQPAPQAANPAVAAANNAAAASSAAPGK